VPTQHVVERCYRFRRSQGVFRRTDGAAGDDTQTLRKATKPHRDQRWFVAEREALELQVVLCMSQTGIIGFLRNFGIFRDLP